MAAARPLDEFAHGKIERAVPIDIGNRGFAASARPP
jgi:hypothetical protein